MCLKFAETCLKIDNMKQLLVSKCPMLTRNKCCCFIDWNFSGANAPPCSSWDTERVVKFIELCYLEVEYLLCYSCLILF